MRVLAAVLLGVATVVSAQEAPPEKGSDPNSRPKVVLVLSGGGARGSAHIGVIKVLEELHVEPDMIVGTSMGSIIGGLYAAGWSVEEIEKEITELDWSTVFVDKLPRKFRTLRRKQDDSYLVPIKMRFQGWKPYLPPSVIGGQSLELLLQRFEIEASGERDFDKFPIAYRAVAANLATGDPVVIKNGSLSTALRASMSVPAVFPPVEMDGIPLCDGGVAANFPVRIAQQLGADVVIGVDISSPLSGKEKLGNLLTRLDQTSSLLTAGNVEQDKAALRPQDILMVPNLEGITFSDFAKAKDAIKAGEEEARRVADKLKPLAVSDEEWAAYKARHHRRPKSDLVIDQVVINNTSYLSSKIIDNRIHVPVGEPLDADNLAKQILRLNGMDTFGTIHHDLQTDVQGRSVLTLDVPKKPYSRNSLQFGFNFEDDFRGSVVFNLSTGLLINPINRLGGEVRAVLQIGDDRVVGAELYQPMGPKMRWFADALVVGRNNNLELYDTEGSAIAQYRLRGGEAHATVGRVFGEWGLAELGLYYDRLRASRRIGADVLPSVEGQGGGGLLGFRVDTLDVFAWPTDGLRVNATFKYNDEAFGSDTHGAIFSAEVSQAKSIGKNVLFGTAEVAGMQANFTEIPEFYTLGGFLRLSGLHNDELIAEDGGLLRLMYYRELSAFSLGSLTQKMYAGISLEVGNVYSRSDPVTVKSLREAGAIFVGANTILGPAYIGYGYTDGGRNSVYLIIGQKF
ncbi:MAG TPA: patatin-like phospholipase family protein [Candidatus Polarisedimenticolaceae bacterium]|nr:patatin-like phospholipase family protein [Candidatus Polarisedimenticolaceae bacterium]